MSVFISYSSRDAAAAATLAEDLHIAGWQPWLDTQLHGGEAWWQKILEQIRTCAVFVLALSEHSGRSQACRAELDYARALGIPIVPVQIGPVGSLRTMPISELQVVGYQDRSATAGIRLVTAVIDGAAGRKPLPHPLPDPPPVPFAILLRLAAVIAEPYLKTADQAAAIGQLRSVLRDEEDERARADAVDLLRQLRERPDCTYNHAREIDEILETATVSAAPRVSLPGSEPTGSVDASARHRLRIPVLVGAVVVVIVTVLLVSWTLSPAPPPERRLTGHTDFVNSVSVIELDGRRVVVSGSNDDTIRIWDITTGDTVRTLIGHAGNVWSVATAELDGHTVIISGSGDSTVRIWDPTTGDIIRTLTGHTGNVYSVATAQLDGRTVVISGGDDKTIRIWDPTGDSREFVDPSGIGGIMSVTSAQLDGRTVIISAGADNTIRIWDPDTGDVLRTLTGHNGVRDVTTTQLDGRTSSSPATATAPSTSGTPSPARPSAPSPATPATSTP